MATKTISLELDAYARLVNARRSPKESFSSVVRRAQWKDQLPVAAGLIQDLRVLAAKHPGILLGERALDSLSRRKRAVRRRSAWE